MGKKDDEATRMNVTAAEFAAANTFLEEDQIGRRLQASEHILVHFAKGQKLKRVKRFLYNMSFDLRQITDVAKFKELIRDPNSELSKLIEQSIGVAEVRCAEVEDKGTIRFYLFYEPGLPAVEYQFHSQNFGQSVATILSSMQFDMAGFQGDNVLKANLTNMVSEEIEKSGIAVDVEVKKPGKN